MTTFEVTLSVSSVLLSAVSISFLLYLVKTSGRDHTVDEKRVRELISKMENG